MFHEYRQRLLGQLSLDFNTDPGSFLEKENIITTSARNAGRRRTCQAASSVPGMLTRLNEELKQYGYQMAPTHHMFLPCRDVRAEERCRVETEATKIGEGW